MKQVLDGCRDRFGRPLRDFSGEMREYIRISRPKWLWKHPFDKLNGIYWRQKRLMREGTVVWGAIVQANNLLFKPGRMDCPAEVIYSFDPRVDNTPNHLVKWAHNLFALKGKRQADPELDRIAKVLAHERIRTRRREIPSEITEGVTVFTGSIMVARKHLPTGFLSNTIFPLVVHDRLDVTMILPARFWTPQLLAGWQ